MPDVCQNPLELRKIAQDLIRLSDALRTEAGALLRSAEELENGFDYEPAHKERSALQFP
jgi:hypothetical protein